MHTKPQITVYSKPQCVQCTATKRYLDNAHVSYLSVDVSTSDKDLARIQELGYTAVPVTLHIDQNGNQHHWYGFRTDYLDHAIIDSQNYDALLQTD